MLFLPDMTRRNALGKVLLSLSIEFGPIIVFLVASELLTFMQAASAFVAATAIALTASYIEQKRIAWFPLIAGVIIIVSGLLTILLDDPFYLIIKDTMYNGIFAVVLIVGLFFRVGLLKYLFDGLFAITDRGWRILSLRWAIMFTLLAVANEIARAQLEPNVWVVFKASATLVTIVFALYQFRLSKQERLPESSAWGMKIIKSI
jgi:intracellular septation protein